VFVLEHYFASKSFAAIRVAFSIAYPDKKVPKETTIHRLATTFRDTGNVCDGKRVRRRAVLKDETLRNVEETMRKLQLLFCKSSLLSALLGVAFGHRDLQTSFCGDFSEK
jgi:hypothetical protein